jgi:hypothetical protein
MNRKTLQTRANKPLGPILGTFLVTFRVVFAFGLSAKLMPKALELLFPHPPLLLIFYFKWLPVSHKMTNDTWHYLLTTFWQLFDNFLTTFWQYFDNFLITFLTTFWQFIFLLFDTMWHYNTFVTSQALIGPYNDGRRHGRGTYLFSLIFVLFL